MDSTPQMPQKPHRATEASHRAVRGQIAAAFVVIMGLALVFINMSIKLGQMAQVRTAVSNASDAGALAGASWNASGQNEAAAIGQKMWDSYDMVQAIYLLPFSPTIPVATITDVWRRLSTYNNTNFRQAADNIMEAAWNLGRRETFTAAVNNMLIRFDCRLNDPFGNPENLSTVIQEQQRTLETVLVPMSRDFHWTNCEPSGDPNLLIHQAHFGFDEYPRIAPTLAPLQPGPRQEQYYQYLPPIQTGHFPCSFQLRGLIDVPRVGPLTIVPPAGAVWDSGTRQGIKHWDVNLTDVYPQVGSPRFRIGDFQACGMQTQPLPRLPVAPQNIRNGTGDVSVEIIHEVRTEAGAVDPVWGIPVWESRFPPARARATARFSSPTIRSNPTQLNATSQIINTN